MTTEVTLEEARANPRHGTDCSAITGDCAYFIRIHNKTNLVVDVDACSTGTNTATAWWQDLKPGETAKLCTAAWKYDIRVFSPPRSYPEDARLNGVNVPSVYKLIIRDGRIAIVEPETPE